jgi:hypothetical protein
MSSSELIDVDADVDAAAALLTVAVREGRATFDKNNCASSCVNGTIKRRHGLYV